MLTRLYVSNYALIHELEIEFRPGVTIITGETGAGKSILLGALSLILGERADSHAVRNPESKVVVEALQPTHCNLTLKKTESTIGEMSVLCAAKSAPRVGHAVL